MTAAVRIANPLANAYPTYTGVGSRNSQPVLHSMIEIAVQLGRHGYRLRSGGATGADSAFERGAQIAHGPASHIFLPWRNFNGNTSPLYPPSDDAVAIAKLVHPAWHKLSDGARLLHGRNSHQVLGKNLNEPSDLLIAWTEGGQPVGGTRTALVIAQSNGIPIINLGDAVWVKTPANDIVHYVLEMRVEAQASRL